VRKLVPLALLVLAIGGCVSGNRQATLVSGNVSIPFSEFGSIYDWRADGRAGIYIESDDRKWFHATFTAPCENLPFTEHVGFHSTPPLPIDKFDSIEVRGAICSFQSLEAVSGPPGKSAPASASPPPSASR
jgi:hypothetical protein